VLGIGSSPVDLLKGHATLLYLGHRPVPGSSS
jgi:hypothetical protein